MEAAPEFFQTGYYEAECFSPEKQLSGANNGDHFVIEDLFDFPNDDTAVAVEAAINGNSADSSPNMAADASFSLVVNATQPHFQPTDIGVPHSTFAAGELSVPCDDLAGLEWVSKFVDESFCSEDLQTNLYQFQPETIATGPMPRPEVSVPAKARSKRSRAAPGNWTSRLQAVSPTSPLAVATLSPSPEPDVAKKAVKPAVQKKKDVQDGSTGGEGRKCLHCATDKTPQWRTGPMGPKTLCNACGVRYKSGRLVPEYRPASSPTFAPTKHSNSHRKVLELRRQKELQEAQSQPEAPPYLQQHHHRHHQNVMFDVPNGDDYLIHPHIGPDYRQMI